MITYPSKITTAAICCALCVLASASAATADDQDTSEPVTVQAIGLHFMTPECSIEQARRAALADARANALTQAHVVMDVRAKTLNMRLTEKTVRSYTAGYIIQSNIIRAGIEPESDPPVYKVVIRARIAPRAEFTSVPIGVSPYESWRPRIALRFEGVGEEAQAYRASLADALARCGMAVVEPEEVAGRRPAILLAIKMYVSGEESAGRGARADWTLSGDSDLGAPTAADAGRISGGSEVSGIIDPESEWWQRTAVIIAQDAARMWNTPRFTWVFVQNGDVKTEKALKSIGDFRRVESRGEKAEVMGFLTIAGDPLAAIQSALRTAGVVGVEVASASLYHVELRVKEDLRD